MVYFLFYFPERTLLSNKGLIVSKYHLSLVSNYLYKKFFLFSSVNLGNSYIINQDYFGLK